VFSVPSVVQFLSLLTGAHGGKMPAMPSKSRRATKSKSATKAKKAPAKKKAAKMPGAKKSKAAPKKAMASMRAGSMRGCCCGC
jgi:hypothetical protein